MSWLGLSRLMVEGGSPLRAVAWRGQTVLNYARFRSDVAAIATAFSGCPAAALLCRDSYRFAAGLFGLLHAGVRVVLPSSSQPAALQCLAGVFDTIVDDVTVVSASEAGGAGPMTPLDPDLAVMEFYTSGSTGAPKRIVKTLAMLEREVAMFEAVFGPGLSSASVLATVPHQHMYGLPFKILWSLAAGRAFSAQTHMFWETVLADMPDGAVIVSSPAHLGRLSGFAPLPSSRRPSLVLSAGAPLSRDASDEAAAILGCRPTEIFGSTETGAIATRCARVGEADPWTLLPGVRLRCDPDDQMQVQTDVVGADWIALSDRITLLEGGFVHHGRSDRIVKIEGKRINLIVVEKALLQHPLVTAAAVVALDAPLRLAAAVVITAEGKGILTNTGSFRFGRQLRQFLRTHLDPAGIPRQWRFIDTLPAHPMGKRRDADIVALFREDV